MFFKVSNALLLARGSDTYRLQQGDVANNVLSFCYRLKRGGRLVTLVDVGREGCNVSDVGDIDRWLKPRQCCHSQVKLFPPQGVL